MEMLQKDELAVQVHQAVTLIGVPTDVGAGRLGAAMGPDALRVAQLGPALGAFWRGCAGHRQSGRPAQPARCRDAQGLRNYAECLAWNQATHDAVLAQLQAGRMPIMLGGDHTLATGSISAVARHCRMAGKRLRVLWLDAHADCNLPDISPPAICTACPWPACAVTARLRWPAWPASRPRCRARHLPDRPAQRGRVEKRMIQRLGLEVFDMRAIDEQGMRAVMQQALAGLEGPEGDDVHLHLSFDVDFLDPDIAPGTGTTVRGGPNYREAQLCMEMIADTGRLASLDIVELNPALDIRNQTAELVVDLVESLFGKSTLVR
jgi:arginase